MKSDLDRLMAQKELDALLVLGPGQHNPAMYYFTSGAHITDGLLVKPRNADPVLFYNPMERDEAASTGLETKNLADYSLKDLLRETDGDFLEAQILRHCNLLEDLGLASSRIAIYGSGDAGSTYALFSGLQRRLPELTIVGEFNETVLLQAMATKDEGEIERIRKMGQITTSVVGDVADYLSSHRAKDEILVRKDGSPLTIGEVKNRINLWLVERGAENPDGTIFAIGRDAGVPHSSGAPDDLLRLGQTIVFDIFPCETGGGYYYDFTRTWCLGYAPDDVQSLYEDVYAVYSRIMDELEFNAPCQKFQARTCELFQERGHPTIQDNPKTQEGYVHSLGHGLGLHVHERPVFGQNATENDRLSAGVVVTIEPGLYYPERGMGVRLEDTVWVRPDGAMEILAEFPMDLVLPVRNGN